jgi:hypothetical protein
MRSIKIKMKIRIILLALLFSSFVIVDSFTQEVPLVYEVENTGADCPEPPLPSFDSLPSIDPLPDPFEWSDGSGYVTGLEDWRCRRAEIGAEVERYEQGTKPPPPDSLAASYTDTLLTVTIFVNEDTLILTVPINLPVGDSLPEGDSSFPAVIRAGFFPLDNQLTDIFINRGIATIQFNEYQITNAWSNVRGDGPFFELFPDKTRGKFIAWAWGVSRIIDGLEKCSNSRIDLSRLAIIGCSYAGKIALVSGAFDERIALTIALESGGGGYTAWRVTETLSGDRERLSKAQGQKWYYQYLSLFNNAVEKLPFDHHELMAMVAPRALFVTGNPSYEWLADESGHVASEAAHEVWKFLGVPDRFGYSIISGHDHCIIPESQIPEIEAFTDKFLLGDTTANTDISTSPYDPDVDRWIEWWGTGEPPIFTGSSENETKGTELLQNYPNPFIQTTSIEYSVQQSSNVELKVFNSMGQLIKTLVDDFKTNGEYSVKWDGRDNSGDVVPVGSYFYRIKIGDFTSVNKMIYTK